MLGSKASGALWTLFPKPLHRHLWVFVLVSPQSSCSEARPSPATGQPGLAPPGGWPSSSRAEVRKAWEVPSLGGFLFRGPGSSPPTVPAPDLGLGPVTGTWAGR